VGHHIPTCLTLLECISIGLRGGAAQPLQQVDCKNSGGSKMYHFCTGEHRQLPNKTWFSPYIENVK